MTAEDPSYACLLCDEYGIHVHSVKANMLREKGMTTTLYQLVDDRDGSFVLETTDRALFRAALMERCVTDTGGFAFPDHFTISITETASGEDAAVAAWSIIR